MSQFDSKNKASTVARRWFTDIDINMTNHPQTGDISLKYDLNAIKRSVKNLVLTNHYERPFKPSLGANIRGMLFELDTVGSKVLETDITELIEIFEPRAHVRNIFVSSRGNSLNVTMLFTVDNSPEPHELDLTLERIR